MYIYIYIHIYIHITYIHMHMYEIMETICFLGYHYNDLVATHALGHMMYGYIKIEKESNI